MLKNDYKVSEDGIAHTEILSSTLICKFPDKSYTEKFTSKYCYVSKRSFKTDIVALDKVLLFFKIPSHCFQKGLEWWVWKLGSLRAQNVHKIKKLPLKPDNLMVLEVREEILRAQVNNKWCDAQRLAIGAVNEKTTYSGEKSREAELYVNFTQMDEAKSFIYISLFFQL